MTSTSSQEFFFWEGRGQNTTYLKKPQAIPAKGVLSEQQMLTMLNFVLLAYESGGQDFWCCCGSEKSRFCEN